MPLFILPLDPARAVAALPSLWTTEVLDLMLRNPSADHAQPGWGVAITYVFKNARGEDGPFIEPKLPICE